MPQGYGWTQLAPDWCGQVIVRIQYNLSHLTVASPSVKGLSIVWVQMWPAIRCDAPFLTFTHEIYHIEVRSSHPHRNPVVVSID